MYVNNFFLSYSFAKKAIRFCFQNLTAFLSCCIQFQNKADCAWLPCYRLTKILSYHQRSDRTSYSHQASSLANVFRRDKTWLFILYKLYSLLQLLQQAEVPGQEYKDPHHSLLQPYLFL